MPKNRIKGHWAVNLHNLFGIYSFKVGFFSVDLRPLCHRSVTKLCMAFSQILSTNISSQFVVFCRLDIIFNLFLSATLLLHFLASFQKIFVKKQTIKWTITFYSYCDMTSTPLITFWNLFWRQHVNLSATTVKKYFFIISLIIEEIFSNSSYMP